MPEEAKKGDLIDVGEADEKATEINLDDKGEPEKNGSTQGREDRG